MPMNIGQVILPGSEGVYLDVAVTFCGCVAGLAALAFVVMRAGNAALFCASLVGIASCVTTGVDILRAHDFNCSSTLDALVRLWPATLLFAAPLGLVSVALCLRVCLGRGTTRQRNELSEKSTRSVLNAKTVVMKQRDSKHKE